MEIDITEFVVEHEDEMTQFSDSVYNSGLDNIGEITWNNALEYANEHTLCHDEDELREHFLSYGAWTAEELGGLHELNALLVQDISAAYQELERGGDECRIYNYEDRWYFYLGM